MKILIFFIIIILILIAIIAVATSETSPISGGGYEYFSEVDEDTSKYFKAVAHDEIVQTIQWDIQHFFASIDITQYNEIATECMKNLLAFKSCKTKVKGIKNKIPTKFKAHNALKKAYEMYSECIEKSNLKNTDKRYGIIERLNVATECCLSLTDYDSILSKPSSLIIVGPYSGYVLELPSKHIILMGDYHDNLNNVFLDFNYVASEYEQLYKYYREKKYESLGEYYNNHNGGQCMTITQYLWGLSKKDKKFDIFVESQLLRAKESEKDVYGWKPSYLAMVDYMLFPCEKVFMSNPGYYGSNCTSNFHNFRVHQIDVRGDTSHYRTDTISKDMHNDLGKVLMSYIDFAFGNSSNKPLRYYDRDDMVFAVDQLKKQLHKCTLNIAELTDALKSIVSGYDQPVHEQQVLRMVTTFMNDVYTIMRMFAKWEPKDHGTERDKNNFPNSAENIVLYAGDAHITFIVNVFNKLFNKGCKVLPGFGRGLVTEGDTQFKKHLYID